MGGGVLGDPHTSLFSINTCIFAERPSLWETIPPSTPASYFAFIALSINFNPRAYCAALISVVRH